MTTSAEQIVALFRDREKEQGPLLRRMREITDAYNGDLVVPLPQLDKNERSFVANLVAQGLDQISMRVASTLPDVMCPAERPGEPRSEQYARIRRSAILGWWDASQVDIKLRRRARHLLGYACTPAVVRPDFEMGIPRWHQASPLHTFPAPTPDPDDMLPGDSIVAYKRSWRWLLANHPDKVDRLRLSRPSPDTMFEVLEYIDDTELVLLAIGQPPQQQNSWSGAALPSGTPPIVELVRLPNRVGSPLIVVPGRITLDRRQGKFDGMIGMYMQAARLFALESIAVERGVFPTTWVIARQGELPKVIRDPDPRLGLAGIVQGGEIMQPANNPGYKTDSTIDRLGMEMRQEGGIPMDFSGVSPTNVRTGRRGDALLSAAIDFPIQEAQALMERSLSTENQIALATAKAYFGSQSKSFYVNWSKAKGQVDYTPDKHFTSTVNFVNYAYPGADAETLPTVLGQRVGIGEMSLQTMREVDPLVDDPEREHERVLHEGFEKSLLAQLAQPGAMTIPDLARLAQIVIEGKSTLFEAVLTVQQEAQARQATTGPPGSPAGPVAPGSPAAQPGVAPPGAGAEAGTVPPPPQGAANLEALLGALHQAPQQQGAAA